MKKKQEWLIIIPIMVFTLIVGGIFVVTQIIFRDRDPHIVSPNQTKTVYSYGDEFYMEIPNDWYQAEPSSLNNYADIEVMNDDDCYMIILMSDKDDYDYNYQDYQEEAFNEAAELYDITVGTPNQLSMGEYDWSYIDYKTKSDGVNLYMQYYVVETPNYYGKVLIWTTLNQKDRQKDTFINMVKTLREEI